MGKSHTGAPEAEDQVQCRFLLDVVVLKGPAVLKLLAGEDQPLLVRGDALLVLDLGLDVLDGVLRLDLQRNRLARKVVMALFYFQACRPHPSYFLLFQYFLHCQHGLLGIRRNTRGTKFPTQGHNSSILWDY